MVQFDVIIIGGGPGGYVAAIRAAQKGACTCLIEEEQVGGTCLNRGCIPTKALYSTARLWTRLHEATDHGIQVGETRFDFSRAMGRKDEVVGKLVGGVEQLLKGHGVEVFRGRASLEGAGKVRIEQRGVVGHIEGKNIILATGSRSIRPKTFPFNGKNVLTSREILAIKKLPQSLLVVGGGYIGCEFSGIFASFGTQVTIVEQLPKILARTDVQAVREVEKYFKRQGVTVHTETAVESLEPSDSEVRVQLSSGETLTVEAVLVSVGRSPNSQGLGLESLGVKTENGAVLVDDGMRTNVEGIFAIGDVTGGIQLAHVASYQAEVAVDNALSGSSHVDYGVIPSVIFTQPEIAEVGLNETECIRIGQQYSVGRFTYMASGKALCDGETRGMVKVLTEPDGGRILGATIVGEEASTLISEVAVAMAGGTTADELGRVIHAHPTLPEMLKEAAEDASGNAVHKMVRRSRKQ